MRYISYILLVFVTIACNKTNDDDGKTEPPTSQWIKSSNNPVLPKGELYSYDFYAVSDPFVLNDNGLYKMWYTGGGAVLPDTFLHSSICYATSVDGLNWEKHSQNPVLDISTTNWDSLGVETASVLIDTSAEAYQRYKMWYAGTTENGIKYNLGYAFSADGVSWTKHPNPVLITGGASEWDNCFLEGPTVVKDEDGYKMWYAGYDCVVDGNATDGKVNIGYATSVDGINWEKYAGNPVLTTTPGAWDAVYVQDPMVIKHDGEYKMWYGGVDVDDNYFQQTGYATSVDGINWTKSADNPVLRRGNPGDWDANTASFPTVIIEGNTLKMWYTGKDVEPLPEFPTPYFWEIGYAEKNN